MVLGRNQILKRLIREFKSTNQIWKSDRYFIRRGATLLTPKGNLEVTRPFCIPPQPSQFIDAFSCIRYIYQTSSKAYNLWLECFLMFFITFLFGTICSTLFCYFDNREESFEHYAQIENKLCRPLCLVLLHKSALLLKRRTNSSQTYIIYYLTQRTRHF